MCFRLVGVDLVNPCPDPLSCKAVLPDAAAAVPSVQDRGGRQVCSDRDGGERREGELVCPKRLNTHNCIDSRKQALIMGDIFHFY